MHAAHLRRPDAKRPRSEEQDSDDDVGPAAPEADAEASAAPPPATTTHDPYRLPITHEAALQPCPRGVATLSLDRAASRLAAGTRGGDLLLFDFGGMKADGAPFRTLTPCEGVPVHAIAWSPTGDRLAVAVGDPRVFFYDRDGRSLAESPRGDMYIRDASHTRGHVAAVTCIAWHPHEGDSVATGSEDGTVRVWRLPADGATPPPPNPRHQAGPHQAWASGGHRDGVCW